MILVPGGLLLIALPLAVWAGLGRSQWTRDLYAVGGDEVAAYAAGVDVRRVRLIAYTFGGAVAGLGGIALTSLLRSGDSTVSAHYILFALTAVALGGTSLAGGRGGMTGSVLGAATIYLVQHLMISAHVPSAWLDVAYGGVLLAAIMLAGGIPGPWRRTPAHA